MKRMQLFSIPAALAIAVLGLLGQGAAQAAYIHTSEAGFLQYTEPGYYLEDFDWLYFTQPPESPFIYDSPMGFFGGDGYGYDISAAGGFRVVDQGNGNLALSVETVGSDLFIAMTTANVTSVGGQFFLTDQGGGFTGGDLIVNLSDGTSVTINSSLGEFLGFTTTPNGPMITSLEVHGSDPLLHVSMDHFYVGPDAAVPEPTTLIAGVLLLLPFGASTLRLLRRNRTA